MKPIKRIEALLAGKKLDKPAINLWKHFPPYDENPKELVKKIIQSQERFNWDFVKVTYQGLWSIQDWGSKIKWPERDCYWPNTCSKVGIVTDLSIKKEDDWKKLHVLPMDQGSWADSILAAKETIKRFKGEAPVVVTLFNPLTTAMKMSGDKMLTHMRQNPDNFKKGLDVITETTVNFVKKLVDIGADGIFFASQLGNYDMMSIKEYEEFGRPYDLQILDVVKDKMWFNIMHMHGNAPMFELMEKYPVQALNWHDRLVDISLKDGRSMSDKLLIGGVDEFKVLNDANEEELLAHFKDALEQVEDQKVILGPGCCVPLYVNEDRFEIAKRLIEKL